MDRSLRRRWLSRFFLRGGFVVPGFLAGDDDDEFTLGGMTGGPFEQLGRGSTQKLLELFSQLSRGERRPADPGRRVCQRPGEEFYDAVGRFVEDEGGSDGPQWAWSLRRLR